MQEHSRVLHDIVLGWLRDSASVSGWFVEWPIGVTIVLGIEENTITIVVTQKNIQRRRTTIPGKLASREQGMTIYSYSIHSTAVC